MRVGVGIDSGMEVRVSCRGLNAERQKRLGHPSAVTTRSAPPRFITPAGEALIAATMSQGWGVLVAKCDKSRSAKHLDRSVDRGGDVTAEPFREQPDIELRLTKTIVGRMLMNAEGTARAQSQVADILIDMPSGACSSVHPLALRRLRRSNDGTPHDKNPSEIRRPISRI